MPLPAHLFDTIAVLGEVDVAALGSVGEIEHHCRLAASVRSWAESVLSALSVRADELASGDLPAGPGGEHTLRNAARMTNHQAAVVARRATVARLLPSFAAALHEGSIAGEHLDAIGRALRSLGPARRAEFAESEAHLLACARRNSPEFLGREARRLAEFLDEDHTANEFDRLTAKRSLRWWRGRDGLMHFAGTFGPDGRTLTNSIEDEVGALRNADLQRPPAERRSTEQLANDALANLIRGGHRAAHPTRAKVVVYVNLADLVGGAQGSGSGSGGETSDGVGVPMSRIWEMAEQAELVPVLLDNEGIAIELAQAARSRLSTFMQRVMLRTMYRTCLVPGCEVPFDDCEIHHVEPYNGRNTVLANLGPVCRPDHHRVHDKQWRIEMDDQRTVTVRLPNGTVYATEAFHPLVRPPWDLAGAEPQASAA